MSKTGRREGPKVTIELECRGCKYLDIWAGMCDTHFECLKDAFVGCSGIRGHGGRINPPKKCPYRRNAIIKFKRNLKTK